MEIASAIAVPRANWMTPSVPVSIDHPGAHLTPRHVNCLLLGLGLATGMEFYTFASLNLVLPDLTASLGVSSDEASWVLTVYSGAVFLGVPVCVWLAGRLGYKRYLLGNIVAFALASAGCAIAPDLPSMLLCRAAQGLAGAGLYVWWRAAIYLLMPREKRGPSLNRIASVLYLSSAAGFLLSGWITDEFHWRLIFVPILLYAVSAAILLARYFPEVPRPVSQRLIATDWIGILFLGVALVSLQVILSRGEIEDWFDSTLIRSLAASGLFFLLLFIGWQMSAHNRTPLLEISLLRDRRILAAALIGTFAGMILSCSLYVLPEYLRNISNQGHSATQTGRLMCTYALAVAVIRPWLGRPTARFGQRKMILVALLSLVAAMILFGHFLTTDTPDGYLVLPLILYACCLAPLMPSVGSGTVARIDQNKLLDGVSFYMSFRQLGASFGIALLTILISHRESLHSTRLFDHVRLGKPAVYQWTETAARILAARSGTSADPRALSLRLLAATADRQAAALSYADAFFFMTLIGAIALCFLPVMPPTPGQPAPTARRIPPVGPL